MQRETLRAIADRTRDLKPTVVLSPALGGVVITKWGERWACVRSSPNGRTARSHCVDRSGGVVRFDVPFHALLDVVLPTYEPDACPLCEQGLPVTKPGSRT